MRLAESAKNPGFFVSLRAAWFLSQGYRGGCDKIWSQGVTKPHSSICLIPLWLSPVNRPARFRRGEKGGNESDPPQKRGGM